MKSSDESDISDLQHTGREGRCSYMCERYARKPDMHNQGQRRKEVKKIMKKKLLSVILAGFMVMGCLAGCTSNDQTVENEKNTSETEQAESGEKQLLQLPGGVQIVKRKHLKTYLQNLKRHIQKLTSSQTLDHGIPTGI